MRLCWPLTVLLCTCRSVHGSQLSPGGQLGPTAKRLELSTRPTASHVALDGWGWPRITQHWSGNRLSSSSELMNLEDARRNGDVQCRASHVMMPWGHYKWTPTATVIVWLSVCWSWLWALAEPMGVLDMGRMPWSQGRCRGLLHCLESGHLAAFWKCSTMVTMFNRILHFLSRYSSWCTMSPVITTYTQPFYGPLSRTTRVSRYQRKHSLTHILYRLPPSAIVSSLLNLRACQWQSSHNL